MDNSEVNEPKSEETKQEQKVDVEALMARLEKLETTNSRLLDESKGYKSKYQELRGQVEKNEKEALDGAENWKELLERERDEKHQIQQTLNDHKKSVIKKDLYFQVAKHAPDAFDVNDIITAIPKDQLQIDEENLSVGGVDTLVNELKANKPYLFNNKKTNNMTTDVPPRNNTNTWESLTDAQKDEEFLKALGG